MPRDPSYVAVVLLFRKYATAQPGTQMFEIDLHVPMSQKQPMLIFSI